MGVYVTNLTEGDIPAAVKVVQEAFAEDPYSRWVFDRSKFNPKRNAASLGMRMRWGIRNGIFHAAKDTETHEVLGVAMWLKPQPADAPQPWSDWYEGWKLYFNQVLMNLWYGRGGLITKRYWIWKAAQAGIQSEIWDDPRGYYFLNIMVVHPKAQGRGVGAKMMREVTQEADSKGMKCYLESSRDVPNVAIYERLGFRLVKDMICDDDGDKIRLFTMIREPHAGPPEKTSS